MAVAANTLADLKEEFAKSIKNQIESCLKRGDKLPDYLLKSDYEPQYVLDTAALLRDAETCTTMAAISRVSGINQKLLSNYAGGLKHPLPLQHARIIEALHIIGSKLMNMH